MRSRSFTEWIQIAGNAGLIAGLVLVAVQIRDSNRIASAEMFSASVESTVAINTAQLGETPQKSMSKVLYKPTEATIEDLYIADRVYDALFRLLVRVHVFEDLEVYGSQEITSRGFVHTHYHAFACPYGLSWLDQTLEKLRDQADDDAPLLESLELMRKLAAANPAESDFGRRREQTDRIISQLAEEQLGLLIRVPYMRQLLMLMTSVLALGGIVIGLAHVFGGLVGYADFAGNGDLGDLVEAAGYRYHDNGSRFLGGIFFTVGLGFAYCLYGLDSKIQLFRFLLLCIFMGGLARIIGWCDIGIAESTISATVIEVVFPPSMLLLERKVHSAKIS